MGDIELSSVHSASFWDGSDLSSTEVNNGQY